MMESIDFRFSMTQKSASAFLNLNWSIR